MGRNVPTLLGIVIILLFALLVMGIYQVTMYSKLAQGQTVVGIAGQSLLTGVEPSTEDLTGGANAPPAPKAAVNPALMQARAGRRGEAARNQQRRATRMARQQARRVERAKPGQ
jgi:hypothetical protein